MSRARIVSGLEHRKGASPRTSAHHRDAADNEGVLSVVGSTLSRILALAMAAFLLIASGVLLWEGLASTMMREHPTVSREVRDARLRLAIGFVGFAIALWIGLGMLTRAR